MRLFFIYVLFLSNAAFAQFIDKNIYFKMPDLFEIEQSIHSSVIGGKIVDPGEAGWNQSVLLLMESKGKAAGRCSGTILARDTILTAAHCVTKGIDSVKIVFGYSPKNAEHLTTVLSDEILPIKMIDKGKPMNVPTSTEQNKDPYLTYDEKSGPLFAANINNIYMIFYSQVT